jgi:hypothetical protein
MDDEEYDMGAAADRENQRVAELEGLLREAHEKLFNVQGEEMVSKRYADNLIQRINDAGVWK